MKQVLASKILRKVLILSCLVIGLVFVTAGGNTAPTVLAARCCSECPVYPGPGSPGGQEVADYCADQCGSDSGSCYDYCYLQATNCQRYCFLSC